MTMSKILGIAVLASFIASWAGRQEEKTQGPQGRIFEQEALKLLDDKAQPWWNQHRPKAPKAQSYNMSPADDLGGRIDPPIYVSQMPVEVAAWLHAGGRPAQDNPLSGRPLVLLDVRRRSEWLAERIPGSVNVPGKEFDLSLDSGELSKLDRKSLLVVFGSKWAHFEITSKLRGPNRFDALYAMEGLEAWKAKRAPVDRDEKLAQFLKETEAERKAIQPPPAPIELDPLPGMDPRALKKLLDAGVDLLCVFVGDRHTYEDGHVPGAHHVPVAQLEKYFADVDKNQLIMVMCGCCMGKRGGPSENAHVLLEKMGYTRVLHLDGHMNAWKIAGLPVQTEDPPPRKKR
jgi:rhodanese-related sulfurtransferase